MSCWENYRKLCTLETMMRTKSTAHVLAEAAEEEAALGDGDHHEAVVTEHHFAQSSHGSSNSESPTPASSTIITTSTPEPKAGLAKVLTVWDVIAYGVGSTVGAGIFAITGSGAQAAGPAVVLSFVVAATACLFSAFSYMEFAARVPVSGSAYTFTYVCLGELAAWFVGWNLTLEYAISAAVVARSWASNLTLFVSQIGGHIPSAIVDADIGGPFNSVSLLAALVCLACMCILLVGVKESSTFNIFITIMNITVILFIICYGAKFVDHNNWTKPQDKNGSYTYFPKGLNGILTGAATVFFSYIGFDAVTTLSEEVKNPKRDVPIGIMATLLISTSLYVGASLVVTGMVPWFALDPDYPLADAFKQVGQGWAATLISAATVTALTGSTLTSLFGQPRIFYRMAKDGLLFSPFASLHPTTKAPLWGTLITGFGAALIALFIPLDSLSNMISIGTLLAFSTVCAGVVIIRYERPKVHHQPLASDDHHPMVNAPGPHDAEHNQVALSAVSSDAGISNRMLAALAEDESVSEETFPNTFSGWSRRLASSAVFWLFLFLFPSTSLSVGLRNTDTWAWESIASSAIICIAIVFIIWRLPVNKANLPSAEQFTCPLVPFLPCLGIFTNIYLISSLDVMSYARVAVWTAIGMAIYFGYGITHSTLRLWYAEKDAIKVSRKQAEAHSYEDHEHMIKIATDHHTGTHSTPLLNNPTR